MSYLKANKENMRKARKKFGNQVYVTDISLGIMDLSADPDDYPELDEGETIKDGTGTKYILAVRDPSRSSWIRSSELN